LHDRRDVASTAGPGNGGTATVRKTEGWCDLTLVITSRRVGAKAALQHLAEGGNIAFQTGFGEVHPESEKPESGGWGLSMDVRYDSRTERLSGS
jgi:hypothetical protein